MHAFFHVAAFLGAVAARSTVLESLSHTPEGWKAIGLPDADRPLHFRIAMTQPDEALFEQTLFDISTPDSPRYGQHMKRSELKEMLKPTSEASEGVNEWLRTAGITQVDDDGEWISFIATVEQAEELLDTQFAVYRNERFNIGQSEERDTVEVRLADYTQIRSEPSATQCRSSSMSIST